MICKSGEVNRNEWLYSVLRGRLNRLVRRTKGYSKTDGMPTFVACAGMAEIGLDLIHLHVVRMPRRHSHIAALVGLEFSRRLGSATLADGMLGGLCVQLRPNAVRLVVGVAVFADAAHGCPNQRHHHDAYDAAEYESVVCADFLCHYAYPKGAEVVGGHGGYG